MLTTILIIWLIFDILVYLLMWYDRKEHNYDIKGKIQGIKDSFEKDE